MIGKAHNLIIAVMTALFMGCALGGWSQYDPQASQYMFLPEAYNPATAAANRRFNVVGLYRMQWLGMDQGPKSMFFAASAPMTVKKQDHSVGLLFEDDEAGAFETQAVSLQYAFNYKLRFGILRLGMGLGFLNQNIKTDSLNLLDGVDEYHQASDGVIPQATANDMRIDVAVGGMFDADDFYVGFSTLHLTQPSFEIGDYVKTKVGVVSFLTGGYMYHLQNPRFTLNADAMFKTDYHDWQLDLNGRVEVDEQWYLGAGYRMQSALVLFCGLDVFSGLSIGYSFDLATTQQIAGNYGSHELFLRYSFLLGKRKVNKYKSVRIL